MDDAQVEHMAQRFLSWKLPEDFRPDAGISFKPTFNDHLPVPMKHQPSGTNLFHYEQAKAMVLHMLDGLSACSPPSMTDAERKKAMWAYMREHRESSWPLCTVAQAQKAVDNIFAEFARGYSVTPPPEANAAQEGDGSEVGERVSEWMAGRMRDAALIAASRTPPPSAPVDAGPVVTAGDIGDTVYKALRDWRCGNIADDVGNGYPLVDLLSNPPPADISTGKEQLRDLAGDIAVEVAAHLTAALAGRS